MISDAKINTSSVNTFRCNGNIQQISYAVSTYLKNTYLVSSIFFQYFNKRSRIFLSSEILLMTSFLKPFLYK